MTITMVSSTCLTQTTTTMVFLTPVLTSITTATVLGITTVSSTGGAITDKTMLRILQFQVVILKRQVEILTARQHRL